jgi:hypothetical protein
VVLEVLHSGVCCIIVNRHGLLSDREIRTPTARVSFVTYMMDAGTLCGLALPTMSPRSPLQLKQPLHTAKVYRGGHLHFSTLENLRSPGSHVATRAVSRSRRVARVGLNWTHCDGTLSSTTPHHRSLPHVNITAVTAYSQCTKPGWCSLRAACTVLAVALARVLFVHV